MSKQYNIRWRPHDEEQLKKAVRNFNAKINRLAKKNPDNSSALPEKVSIQQMKEIISTRNDFNRELNSLRRFSKRGSEELVVLPNNKYNTKITKWEKREMQMYAGLVTKARKKRLAHIEEIEKTSGGKSLGYTVKEFGMGEADKIALRPIHQVFYPTMDRRNAHKRLKSYKKQAQDLFYDKSDLKYKQNYIRSLLENYNERDVHDVIECIEEMSMQDFFNVIKAEDPDFEFSYPPDEEQYRAYLNQVKSIWLPKRKSNKGNGKK